MTYEKAIFESKLREYIKENLKIKIESVCSDTIEVKILLEDKEIDSDCITI